MPKLLKKILISLVLSLYLLSLSLSFAVPQAKAAEENPWYWQNFPQWYTKVYDTSNESEIFGERYTAAQVMWVAYAIPGYLLTEIFGPKPVLCIFSGDIGQCLAAGSEALKEITDKIDLLDTLFNTSQGNSDKYYASNKEGKQFSFIKFFYNQPVSSIGYILKTGERLKLVPETKAQGFGFNTGANPVQELWKLTRNIAYFFLIIVILIVAFMIMFRVKISPQAVISIQSALPKIVITIILVTFSYAIAGFLIDLMYVIIGLFSSLVVANGLTEAPFNDTKVMFSALTDGKTAFGLTWQFAITFLIASFSVIFSLEWLGGILAFLFAIVVLLLAIITSIKITWMLVKTFVNIMLLIIVAPLEILLGAISQGAGFGSWFNKMMANLLVYPVVGILFFLSFVFLRGAIALFGADGDFYTHLVPFNITNKLGGKAWEPPLTFGTEGARFLWLMAAYGIYVIIPKTAELIKSIMARKPFDFETAMGEAVGPAAGVARVGGKEGGQWLVGRTADYVGTRYSSHANIQNLMNWIMRRTRYDP